MIDQPLSNILWLACLFASAFFLTLVLTAYLRRYALASSMLDIPNQRSSHSVPTPRGGGVAVVVSLVLAAGLMYWLNLLAATLSLPILVSGGVVAIVGFLDDHGHIAARWRLLAHFSAAITAVYWLGGLPPIELLGAELPSGVGYVVAVLLLVWMLNLYNFMDGIDGIAGIQAITTCVGGAILYVVVGQPAMGELAIVLACSVAGFLVWNFPPARIFMGDAGSGFLGFVLGVFALQAGWVQSELFFSWLILLGVFVVDATLTLLVRLLRGERVYEAHRSHAYQHAALKYGSHLTVSLTVLLINILWLFPLAYLVAMQRINDLLGLSIAYMPLVFVALKFRAGRPT
ncbi:glycosyltransferase family 4 protein [Alcaligenaceae bacterium]|nr:glycosyltransferase family 4 protein [Alcaligenaceae bacterium]